jgi:hypothetical protein
MGTITLTVSDGTSSATGIFAVAAMPSELEKCINATTPARQMKHAPARSTNWITTVSGVRRRTRTKFLFPNITLHENEAIEYPCLLKT